MKRIPVIAAITFRSLVLTAIVAGVPDTSRAGEAAKPSATNPSQPAAAAAGAAVDPKAPKKEAKKEMTQEERCAQLVLNGYRIGMPKEAALKVRPALAADKAGNVRVQEKGRLTGVLNFDPDGKLIRWSATYIGAEPEGLKALMREKFGIPRKEDTLGQLRKIKRKYWRFNSYVWQEESCDTRIQLETGKKLKDPRVTQVTVLLTPPPDADRKDEFKKKAESWIK